MQTDTLTRMERPGFVSLSNPKPAERSALALAFTALRGAGHAVVADEVVHGDDSVTVSVLHYRSCKRCQANG